MPTVFLTSESVWTIPPDTNCDTVVIEVIGAGGGGGTSGCGGGGGGGYSKKTGVSGSPGDSIDCHVGVGSAYVSDNYYNETRTTWFGGTGIGDCSCGAKGGRDGTYRGAGGAGGDSADGVGDAKYSGAAGGSSYWASYTWWGGYGGGAAGLHGGGTNCTGDAGNTACNGNGVQWDSSHGSGGGGSNNGASGGLYGGGGAGHDEGGGSGGSGRNGLIVITYSTLVKNHLKQYRRTRLPGPVEGEAG